MKRGLSENIEKEEIIAIDSTKVGLKALQRLLRQAIKDVALLKDIPDPDLPRRITAIESTRKGLKSIHRLLHYTIKDAKILEKKLKGLSA